MGDTFLGQKVKDTFGQLVRIKNGAFEDGLGNALKLNVNFNFNQNSPSLSWDIVHNLNRIPAVTIMDTAGNVIWGDVNHIDINHLVVNFTQATSGTLWCS